MSSRYETLVARVLRLPRPLLVALDVDGTLAPIVEDPDAARVPRRARALLRRLSATRRVHLALVTGRSASSLRAVVGNVEAWRALEHGRIIVPPGRPVPRDGLDAASRERLLSFERWARDHVVPHGGRLEKKRASRSVHVRGLADRDPDEAARLLRAARIRAKKLGLSPRPGRAVLEAEAAPGDKGEALDAIRFAARAQGVFYAGDDVTDEPAIRRAVRLGGVGVFVRSEERPRAPRGVTAIVAGPDGMAELLEEIAAGLERRAR